MNAMDKFRFIYSSTSTVLAEGSLSHPDYDQVLFCIAVITQTQIFEDCGKESLHPEFNLEIELPYENGGHVDPEEMKAEVLDGETFDDPELKERILAGVVPLVDSIFRFLCFLLTTAKFSPECNIIAWIYISRIIKHRYAPITMKNWRGFLVSAIMLAQKFWDDIPLKTSQFVRFLPSTTSEQLRDVERKLLTLLDYYVIVKPSEYANFYFELSALFLDIMGPKSRWKLKPLSAIQGKVLEQKAKKAITIGKNTSVVPTGEWADTGNKGKKSKYPQDGKGLLPEPPATETTTTAVAASAGTDSCKAAAAAASIAHCKEGGKEDGTIQPPQLPEVDSLAVYDPTQQPPPALAVVTKASDSDDEDDWDRLPVSINADNNIPIPPAEEDTTATVMVVSKQPFLPPKNLPARHQSTPIMSPRMSKKTMMSPSRASFSSFERVPVIPPVPTNDTSNSSSSSSSSAKSTPAYSTRQIAQIYRNHQLPKQARPVTLEDYDVNSKARFIIS